MTSTVKVNNLRKVSESADRDISGVAAAWSDFNGATAAIGDSLNVSSLTDNAVGDYSLSLTSALGSVNSPCVSGQFDNGQGIAPTRASSVSAIAYQGFVSGSLTDFSNAQCAAFGDLA